MINWTDVKTAALIIVLFLSGCGYKTKLLIYNNTDQPLIVGLGHEQEIKQNKFAEFSLPYADAIYLLVIDSRGRTQYDLPLVSREYIKSGVAGDEIKMQIDPKRIYVVLPDTEFPALGFSVQPNGYPLTR